MAVSIMSACCRAFVLVLVLLGCFLQVLAQGQVFQPPQEGSVFLRSKRANQFLFEEFLQGDLERECFEELCKYEEARECFEDDAKTMAFWTVYIDGDQCQPNPCLHGGNCTDQVNGFLCSCPAPYFGPACELREREARGRTPVAALIDKENSECPTEGPTACHQLCVASHYTFTCSCMSGFKLQADGRSCLPEVEFPCGRLPNKFNTTASLCRHGNCPWQVTLLSSSGLELCAGVVLGRFSVLTAARCLFVDSGSELRPSNFYVVAGDRRKPIPVQALFVHNRFRLDRHDYDLALLELARPFFFSPSLIHLCLPTKDFSEHILMHPEQTGIVESRGASPAQGLVYMTLDECRQELNVSHSLSNKMFCMRRQNGPLGNQNRVPRSPNGAPGNQNGDQRQHNASLGNQNGTQGSQIQLLGDQNGSHERLNHSQNQTQNNQSWAPRMANGAANIVRSKNHGSPRSQVRRRQCGNLLRGAPVATVEQGTAFLTGLLMSSTAECDGGGHVFTKLSRYLNWIKPRLEASEDHMTAQVLQYPENR